MAGRRRVGHRLVACLLAIVSAGCYRYVPLEEGVTPRPGDEVRVYVPEEGSASDADGDEAGGVRGLVVQGPPDSLFLSVRVPPARAGTFDRDLREMRRFAYPDIRRIERPELDPFRTGVLVVGGLGVLAGFMAIVLSADSSGGAGDGGGGGPSLQIRIP